MTTSPRTLIAEQMKDPEYRAAFVEQAVRRFLPAQIRAMRDERGWNQEELGRRCGKSQEWISKLESQTYGRFSTQTLIDLAHGFDVGLIVRLASFGSFLDWYTSGTSLGGLPAFGEDSGVLPADGASLIRLVSSDSTPVEATFTANQEGNVAA